MCVSVVALSPLHARLADCQRVDSAGNRAGYLASLGYSSTLGCLGTLGYSGFRCSFGLLVTHEIDA